MSTIKTYFLPTLFAILLHTLALSFLSDFWGPSKSINAETFEPKVVSAKLITIERSRTQKKPKPEQAKVMKGLVLAMETLFSLAQVKRR